MNVLLIVLASIAGLFLLLFVLLSILRKKGKVLTRAKTNSGPQSFIKDETCISKLGMNKLKAEELYDFFINKYYPEKSDNDIIE